MKPVGEILREKNLELATDNAAVRGGFTQVPNFILEDARLSPGAKVVYGMFLRYAWDNDFCFPGQERLAQHLGMSRPRVTDFVGELEEAGLVKIQRRGQGKTNLYTVHFQVRWKARRPEVSGLTSRSRQTDRQRSANRLLSI